MLVLTRKIEESIILGNNIEIMVLAVEEGKVKLGIKAPKEVEIHRKEIYLAIENENKAASTSHSATVNLKEIMKKK